MESDFNWLHLPDFIWELILCNLEIIWLLRASRTCKKFNDLISMSKHSMKKIRFMIKNNDSEINPVNDKERVNEEALCELKLMRECLQKSKRKYDSIVISVLVDHAAEKYLIDLIFDILKQLAGSVKEITFHNAALYDDNFFKIIQILENLNVLKFIGNYYDRDQPKAIAEIVRSDIVSSVREKSLLCAKGFSVVLSTWGSSDYIIKDFSFREGILNPTVENLELSLNPSLNTTELIHAFTKLFPNVKNFTYAVRNSVDHGLDQINNWRYLETINIKLININRFFENISVEKLTTCNIDCFHVGYIKKPQLIEFLDRHQNIKHITLKSEYGKVVPDEIIFLIVNTLKSLETLIHNGKSVPCRIT